MSTIPTLFSDKGTPSWLMAACVAVLMVTSAEAQTRPQSRPPARTFQFRGFVDGGSTTFNAQKSFKAILGNESGPVYGGGVEAVLPQLIFLNLRASRFQKTGQRVFVFEDKEYPLGIPETIEVTPVELTAGYRFDFGSRLVPYGGGGVGWHRFADKSEFADTSENFEKTYLGYQLLAGAEFRLASWLGAATEAQWSWVPKALGQNENSVSSSFDETDLGGTTFRVKLVIGR